MSAVAENPTPLLDGRHALVIGLGRTGLSLARSLPALGARVRAADRRTSVAGVSTLEPGVEIVLGRDGPDLLAGIDLVVPSPGVPADAAVLTEAVRRGIPVRSEIEVAFLALDAPVLAVTGTNGKSTTTSLLGAMLEQAGFRVFTGGNLGTPLIDAIGGGFDLVVAEVSSFQLEWVDAFRPAVGLLLNVTDDHLDRYSDFSHYAETKARIFARQREADLAVLNRDDPWSPGSQRGPRPRSPPSGDRHRRALRQRAGSRRRRGSRRPRSCSTKATELCASRWRTLR